MDDRAAPQAAGAGGAGLASVSEALTALRREHGDGYVFGHDQDGYWGARRSPAGSGWHRAQTPQELRALLAAAAEAAR